MKVGVTGHQEFESHKVQRWVEQEIRNVIMNKPVEIGLTCLARGTDQLFARILLEEHLPYIAIIASHDYEKTFPDEAHRKEYEYLLAFSQQVIRIGRSHATSEAFFAASRELVSRADLVIAVWNGFPAKGLGGTADVVSYALQRHKPVVHINVAKGTTTSSTE